MVLGARLTRRLVLAFLFVALVPLGLLAIFGPRIVRRHFEALSHERIAGVHQAVLRDLDRRRETARLRIETLASSPDVVRQLMMARAGGAPPLELIDATVERRTAAGLAWLEVTDADGMVLARGHDRGAFGFSVADDPLVAAALTGLSLAAVIPLAPPDSGLALLAAAPVSFQGEILGVVRGGDLLDGTFVGHVHTLAGAEIAVLDSLGRTLASSLPASAAAFAAATAARAPRADADAEEDTTLRIVHDGVPYRVAAVPLAGPAGRPVGRLAVGVSEADLERTLESLLRLLAAATLIGLFVAVGVALVIAERVTRPVRALAHAAQRVAHGDLAVRLPAGPNDEVGDLMGAFNAMTVDLSASRERLVRGERQSAWAQVARRLAHEIKNPLTPIVLAVEEVERAHARGDADLGAIIGRAARTTRGEVHVIRQLVDEFGDFARSPAPRPEPVDLHELLDQAADLYASSTVTVDRDYDPAGGEITVDPALMARAFGNLVKNACEAMDGRGTLTLATRHDGGELVITCADQGPGIPADDRDRIFTPYFTTKPEGTGLGLAIVRRIVEDHGGSLALAPPPPAGAPLAAPAGARFLVRLPLRPPAAHPDHTPETP
jgi:nitrogen fixation/metabolism regulation signal transduction histidine kinase